MTDTCLSLYSGLGAGALGAQQAGYTVTACVERDRHALATLRANGLPALEADTTTWSPEPGTHPDAVIGGPPCQPFSAAGRQTGEDDPRDCIPHFIRLVRETRPRLFVLENVRGLTFKKNAVYLRSVLLRFQEAGYTVTWNVLNAADYGVPQTRQRLFIVGRTDAHPELPAPTHGGEGLPPHVTAAEALAHRKDLPEWAHRRASTTVVGSFSPEVQAPPTYRKAGDGPRQSQPDSFITTPAERLILQGIPADWEVKGPKTAVNLQIGNACPPGLIRQVLEVNR